MKPYIHNPQVFREHFGRGDTVFRGARRQKGHGAITKFAVPLVSSGIKKASPFLKSFARKAVQKIAPNNPFAQQIANSAVEKVTKTLSSRPMIEKVIGSVKRRGQQLFKRTKRRKPHKSTKNQKGKNIFY
jgi:hypothetical protein